MAWPSCPVRVEQLVVHAAPLAIDLFGGGAEPRQDGDREGERDLALA